MKTALRSHSIASAPVFERIEDVLDRRSRVAFTNPINYSSYWPPLTFIAARSGYSNQPPSALNPDKFPA
jgi:hypothetical protein